MWAAIDSILYTKVADGVHVAENTRGLKMELAEMFHLSTSIIHLVASDESFQAPCIHTTNNKM